MSRNKPRMKTIPALCSSIDMLINEARTIDDLYEWFKHNLHTVGITQAIEPSQVAVTGNYNVVAAIAQCENKEPVMRVDLTISFETMTNPHSSLDQRLLLVGQPATQQETKLTVDLPYSQWPFLTCLLTTHLLNGRFDKFARDKKNALEQAVAKNITRHFPGMTLHTLKLLHAADMLPSDGVKIHGKNFADLLFARRHAGNNASLPDTFDVGFHDRL